MARKPRTVGEPSVKELLELAAIRMFADRGYHGTTIQDIVATANVTKPMLYYYFEDKDGLYADVLQLVVRAAQVHTRLLLMDPPHSLRQQVIELSTHLDRFAQVRPDYAKILLRATMDRTENMFMKAGLRFDLRNAFLIHDLRKWMKRGASDHKIDNGMLDGLIDWTILRSLNLAAIDTPRAPSLEKILTALSHPLS